VTDFQNFNPTFISINNDEVDKNEKIAYPQ